jgi:hypothetical protein
MKNTLSCNDNNYKSFIVQPAKSSITFGTNLPLNNKFTGYLQPCFQMLELEGNGLLRKIHLLAIITRAKVLLFRQLKVQLH